MEFLFQTICTRKTSDQRHAERCFSRDSRCLSDACMRMRTTDLTGARTGMEYLLRGAVVLKNVAYIIYRTSTWWRRSVRRVGQEPELLFTIWGGDSFERISGTRFSLSVGVWRKLSQNGNTLPGNYATSDRSTTCGNGRWRQLFVKHRIDDGTIMIRRCIVLFFYLFFRTDSVLYQKRDRLSFLFRTNEIWKLPLCYFKISQFTHFFHNVLIAWVAIRWPTSSSMACYQCGSLVCYQCGNCFPFSSNTSPETCSVKTHKARPTLEC